MFITEFYEILKITLCQFVKFVECCLYDIFSFEFILQTTFLILQAIHLSKILNLPQTCLKSYLQI